MGGHNWSGGHIMGGHNWSGGHTMGGDITGLGGI